MTGKFLYLFMKMTANVSRSKADGQLYRST